MDGSVPFENQWDLLRAAIQSTGQGVLCVDLKGRITFANPAAARMLGRTSEALAGQPHHGLFHSARPDGSPLPETDCAIQAALRDQREHRAAGEQFQKPDGAFFPVEYVCTPIRKRGKPSGAAILFSDVTDRKRLVDDLQTANRTLERLALVDPLTELLNRRGIERSLAVEIQRVQRRGAHLVAVLADLDDFQQINDTLGHAVGDVVLKEIARKLRGSLRPTDHVARVSGDGFLLLLPETKLAEGLQVAERVRLALTQSPVELASGSVQMTASLGVAALDRETVTIDEVLGALHPALRRSKENGKNRVSLLAPRDGEPAQSQRDLPLLVESLRRGEGLRALAQPILDLADGRTAAYEFLSRGPKGIFEMPNDFFRICLENNVLTTVDRRCIEVCVEASRRTPPGMRSHINLFPSTLLDVPSAHLVGMFPADLPAGSFCVEISEQQLIGDPSYLSTAVEALKSAGILIAVDDVGFGRSCLESLILLEPDVIKIDRRCIHGISKHPAMERSLKRLLTVASELGAEVVAEGVEDPADLALLKQLGVRYGQGYLLGRPA